MERKQEDRIDELSTMCYANESMVVSDTSGEDQDSQNSLLERLIKLVSSIVLHRPTSQLLKEDILLLNQVTAVRLPRLLPCGMTYVTVEKI